MTNSLSRITPKFTIGTGITLLLFLTSCFTTLKDDALSVAQLPSAAVGAITIGPEALPLPGTSQVYIVTFDSSGNITSLDPGKAIYHPYLTAWEGAIAAPTATRLLSLRRDGRTSTDLSENMLRTSAIDESSKHASFWFNSGTTAGNSKYHSNYIIVDSVGQFSKGSVPGFVFASAQCGDRGYAIVAPYDNFGPDLDTMNHQLFVTHPKRGSVELSAWKSGYNSRPATGRAACDTTNDGNRIASLYKDSTNRFILNLIVFNVPANKRTMHSISLNGRIASVADGTIQLLDGSVFWIDLSGQMLSASPEENYKAKARWQLPARIGNDFVVSTTRDRVAVIDARGDATYSEYEIHTGRRIRGPIKLPWLPGKLKKAGYGTVASVTSIPGQ